MGWRSSKGKPLRVRTTWMAAPLIAAGATTTAQAQQVLDQQMGNLLNAGDPNFIKANVTNNAIAAMTAISSVGPTIPSDLQQNVNSSVATIANYNLSGAPTDVAIMVTLGQYLYNTMQQILYSIGASPPSGIPGNLSYAIFNWFRSYNIVGCTDSLSGPTQMLQNAMVMSPGAASLDPSYTQGAYDSPTATALQSLMGNLTQVPTPCVGMAAAAPPGPLSPPPSPPTPVTTPAPVPTPAPSSIASSSTPWIVGGAVVAGATILWLVLRKK